ncbi:MAG TPA: choice-of-anchor E domain-containing protein [Caldilineaceae bacterium]|nr:choice-of-anchor E domain-containing protein [Caldilineaceae bacterium]
MYRQPKLAPSIERPVRRYLSIGSITALLFLALLFSCEVARAETIVVSDHIPPRNTNWSGELVIPAFDPEWGELTTITLTFETPITGSVSYENTSNDTVLITSTHGVTASLELPDGSLIYSRPNAERIDLVPPSDGIADFQGESGGSFEMTTTMVITQKISSPELLSLFIGKDSIHFPVTAVGASRILGPGNFDAIFRAQAASAGFTLYYVYEQPQFVVEKLTNQQSADDADGVDVPVVAPGASITWTYVITNIGRNSIAFADIHVTDSDPNVSPIFDPASDDGDRMLSPGEVWYYYAVGTALDLRLEQTGSRIVDGCRAVSNPLSLRAYQNQVTVTIGGIQQTDLSHYCNLSTRVLRPGLALTKLINNSDANDPNALDVPYFTPNMPITWTYLITNTGDITFPYAAVQLTDDDPTITIMFDSTSDDGDAILSPGEVWRFWATGIARDLQRDTVGVTVVPGCDPDQTGDKSGAYRNIATLVVNEIVVTDPAHYCNTQPTSLTDRSDPRRYFYSLFVPFIANAD